MIMQFYVKEMPEKAEECVFSHWQPFPPAFRELGLYQCEIGNSKEPCSLKNNKCRHLCVFKEEEK
ncbi:MAG: hypothetical protein IKN65_06680 [Clostridia bacterium]|nr:hypothetical protein [Clostridia bacterium]